MNNIPKPHDVVNKIKKLYSTSGYLDKHGSDVWISVIICIVFSLVISYYYYTNVLEVVRADWHNQRCNPLFIPFAGLIHKPQNQTKLEYTADNFNGCIKSMLKSIAEAAIEPFALVVRILDDACKKLVESFNLLRDLINNLRKQYGAIIKQFYSAITNLLLSFINFVIKMKDTFAKIQGIMTTALYSMVGSYLTLQSLFTNIIVFIIFILIIIAAIIVCLIILYTILYGIPFVGAALATPVVIKCVIITLIMICILIPILWFKFELMRAMRLSTPPTPGVPGCFCGDTNIDLVHNENENENEANNDYSKKIKDIQVGDILKRGGKVTAFIKLSASEQNIYNLNGVIITGEHRVFYTPDSKWIKVKEHPDSIYVPDFNEPFVYCLNTSEKCFKINETIYSDWDDIDENIFNNLKKNCVSLSTNITHSDIHTQLDSGFTSDMSIKLNTGITIPICDIKINDTLLSGDKVLGIFKIASHDINVYKHCFKNGESVIGTKNIHIHDSNLGIINCMEDNSMINSYLGSMNVNEPLYHLLTNTGSFVINNIRVNDYNSGIDIYQS